MYTSDQQSDTASHKIPHHGNNNLLNTTVATRMVFHTLVSMVIPTLNVWSFLNVWNANHMA